MYTIYLSTGTENWARFREPTRQSSWPHASYAKLEEKGRWITDYYLKLPILNAKVNQTYILLNLKSNLERRMR